MLIVVGLGNLVIGHGVDGFLLSAKMAQLANLTKAKNGSKN